MLGRHYGCNTLLHPMCAVRRVCSRVANASTRQMHTRSVAAPTPRFMFTRSRREGIQISAKGWHANATVALDMLARASEHIPLQPRHGNNAPPLQLHSIWHSPTSCRNCMLRRAAQRPTTRGTHCANGRRALRRSRGAILTQAALYTRSRQPMRYGLRRCDCNRWPAPRGATQPCNAMRAVAMPTRRKCTRCGYIRARPRRPRYGALARFARKLYQVTPASQQLSSTRRGTRLKPDLCAHLVSRMIPFFKREMQGRRSVKTRVSIRI